MTIKTPVTIPAHLERSLNVALYVDFKAGNAGPCWAEGKARNVRVPYGHNLAMALDAFDRILVDGFSGQVPDAVRVAIEPYNGRSYKYADCAPFIGVYASHTREA